MPFTFSHPAIVIPFRKYLSLTGLIIGSMSPDFEYFIKMKISNVHGHSIYGMFYYDLPISLIIAFLYHTIIREILIINLPNKISQRLHQFIGFNWKDYFASNYFKVIISVLIGACSHIFWDSFTHDTGFFVNKIEILKQPIIILKIQIPTYKILQHFSSIVGAIIILYYFYRLPVGGLPTSSLKIKYWLFIIAIMTMIVVVKLITKSFHLAFGNLIVTFIPSLFLAILSTSFYFKKVYRKYY